MDDPRPVVRCLVAWWSDKRRGTPIVRPKGDTCGPDGKRHVCNAAMTLEEAAAFAEMGFDVMRDPFDLEVQARWDQLNKPPTPPTPKRWLR